MVKFSRLTGSLFKTKLVKSPLRHSYEVLAGLFAADNREEQWVRTVLGLIHTLLNEEGSVPAPRIEILRRLIEAKRGADEASRRIKMLKEASVIMPEEAASALEGMEREELEKLIRFLILLALAANVLEGKRAFLADFAAAAGVGQSDFDRMIVSAKAEKTAQEHLIRSGAGVIAALGVIAVFILTATLLRSVIFGLIGAYLLLPLEKFFEKSIRRKGVFFYLVRAGELFWAPLNRLTRLVKRHNPFSGGNDAAQRGSGDKKVIKQAVFLTVFLVLAAVICVAAGAYTLTGIYVAKHSTGKKIIYTERNGTIESPREAGLSEKMTEKFREWKNRFNERVENDPRIRQVVEILRENFDDDKTRNELLGILLRFSGGVVNFTAGLVGTLISVISDVVLSVFFGLLFLIKLAEFCGHDSGTARQSEYLVRTVFNGKWLPGANENTIVEARNILTGTFARLRIWVKGYGTLILIDSIVYSCIFFVLQVPYFPVFGIIAGCGILLPYIGPVLCCVATLAGTVVLGGFSGSQLLVLFVCYLIYSGIIEQFILYPAVIGESLGLTSLETVIVVLLGAVFAGIAGMIFALPAASVIKFIVPQIYRCWGKQSGENRNTV